MKFSFKDYRGNLTTIEIIIRHILEQYLLVTGAIALIVLFFPVIVALGLLFFILPGLILAYVPIFFLYPFSVYCIAEFFNRYIKWRYSFALGIILTAILSFLFPAISQFSAYMQIEYLRAGDKTINKPISTQNTIAILYDGVSYSTNESMCSRLCQNLLSQGAVKQVLVGEKKNVTNRLGERKDTLKGFSLLAMRGCSTQGRKLVRKMVIISPECLQVTNVPLASASMIWREQTSQGMKRLELYRREGDELKLIYRKTKAYTSALSAPIFMKVNGDFHSIGLRLDHVSVGDSSDELWSSEKEYVQVFGVDTK